MKRARATRLLQDMIRDLKEGGSPWFSGRGVCLRVVHRREPERTRLMSWWTQPTQQTVNRSLSRTRASLERDPTRLKIWKIFRKARCSPNRMTSNARAILTRSVATLKGLSEPFQRCLSRVRAAAMAVMRFGLQRLLRKIRQDFRRATPRSTGARARASARFSVSSVGDSSPPAGRRIAVVTQGPTPM